MTSSEDIERQIAELVASVEANKIAIAPVQEQQTLIAAEKAKILEEYKAKIAIAQRKQTGIDEDYFAKQRLINQNEREAERLRIALQEAKIREAQEAQTATEEAERYARNAALREKFHQLTMGAPWREWANPHQIDGGTLMTEDRYVILADPMGLGKTLTSIIAVEMLEAATRDASPDFPYLGEEKEVRSWVNGKWVDEFKIVGGIERPVGKRVLYLCPASLLGNVMEEWRRWTPHRNVTFIGKMPKAARNFFLDNLESTGLDNYTIICNYEAWRKDVGLLEKLNNCDFDTIIIDEAHNAKDMKSIVYRGIENLTITNRPEAVFPMTGTPVLNRPEELYTLLHIVNPQEFYNLNSYLYQFCEQTTVNGRDIWVFQPGGIDRLVKRIRKNFIRRTKDQAGIELPDKTITVHELEVDKEAYPNQHRARKEMTEYATIMIDEKENKALAATAVIAMYTRLRQIETWPAGIVSYAKDSFGKVLKDPFTDEKIIALQIDIKESQKIDYCIKFDDERGTWDGLIPEAIEDERIVLFSQFKAPLREIERRVIDSGKRAIILDGDTPDKVKEEIRHDFDLRHTSERSNSKWDIVLCNYRVGGVGLNLTAATQLIALDEEWNPGKRDQAFDRIHRIGQTKPVTIHIIRDKNTVDDWLAGILEQKESIVDDFEAGVTATNTADLKRLLEDGYGD